MTDTERKAIYEYLREQRRHLLAQVKACELLMQAMQPEPKVMYNSGNGNGIKNVTATPAPEFRE